MGQASPHGNLELRILVGNYNRIPGAMMCADTNRPVMVESHGCVQTAERRTCEGHVLEEQSALAEKASQRCFHFAFF